MSKINIDFNSILQPIKDAQNELTKLLAQMQEASKASQSMAAGIRSSGGSRFSSIEAAGNYVKNMRSIHGDNVIAMPGVPLSNLELVNHSGGTNLANSPVAAAAKAASSNIDVANVARLNNMSVDYAKNTQSRSQLITNLGKSDDIYSKVYASQLSEASGSILSNKAQMDSLVKQAFDSNGKEIKENTEVNKKLQELMKEHNRLLEKSNSLEADARQHAKNSGGSDDGGSGEDNLNPNPNTLRRMARAGAIVAGVGKAIGFIGEASSNILKQDAFADIQTRGASVSAQQYMYQQQMMAAAPASGRDMLRQYGELIAPSLISKDSYLGTRGVSNALKAATSMQAKEMQAEKVGAVSSLIGNTLLAAGSTAAAMAIGGKAGAVIGSIIPGAGTVVGGLVGAGVAGVAAAGVSLYQSSQTKLGKSLGGPAALDPTGFFSDEAGRQRQLFKAEQLQQQTTLADQLQNQELNRPEMERRARGLDIRSQALNAQMIGTSLVGGQSVNGINLMAGQDVSAFGASLSASRRLLSDKNASFSQKAAAMKALMTGTKELAAQAGRVASDTLMDAPELASLTNMYMSVGGKESDATRFSKLRFGGVGTSEQLAGNMFALQSSTNKPISLAEFEKTLSEGIAAGFSKAPLMQAFMSTLTQLSQNLGIANTEKISGNLGSLSGSLSTSGVGGIRSLREAANAMSSMAGYTSQTGGVVGMMKTVAGSSGGLTIGTGLSILNTMNTNQLGEVSEAMKQVANSANPAAALEQLEKDNKITKSASRIIRSNMGNLKQAAKAVDSMSDASQGQLRGMVNLALGGDVFSSITKRMGELMLTKGGTRSSEFLGLEAKLAMGLEGSGVDLNNAMMMAKDSAYRGMTPEQISKAEKNLKASGGEMARAVAQGRNKADADGFLAAQKSLSAKLSVEAASDAGGTITDEQAAGYITDLKSAGISSVQDLRKRLNLKDGQSIKAMDISSLLAQGAGDVKTVNIGGFTRQALNDFSDAMTGARQKDATSKKITEQPPAVPVGG